MSDRKAIEERIHRKTNEIATLEEKLKAAKVYIKAMRDVLVIMDKEAPEEAVETKLRRGSLVDQAREIILERDTPVHIDDLLRAMGKEVTREAKGSLNGSLAAYVRNREIFVRTAPATYGLIELSHAPDDNEEEDEAPPAGFGQAPVGWADDVDDDIPF